MDVGCGIGKLSLALKFTDRKSVDYLGVDICPDRIKLAKEYNPGYEFKRLDLSVSPLPEADIYYMYDPVNLETLKKLKFPEDSVIYYIAGAKDTQYYMDSNFRKITYNIYIPRK